MKWLLRSILLIAIVGISCTTNNTTVSPVSNSLAPTITRLSPDTVWTLDTLTIYGTNFGYDPLYARVIIDTAVVNYITYLNDTIMTVIVPEGAQTGFINVWGYEKTATSSKPVVVNYTFNPHSINDTLPDGASFSIPGTGMNNYHGLLRLIVGGAQFPIDSVFPNRIVSHVLTNSPGGYVYMYDSSGGSFNVGSLTVTRHSAWTTLSQIYNYIFVTETHTRTGYTNGVANTIDSTWTTKVTYLGQHDTNIAGLKFVRTTTGLQGNVGPYQIVWDTGRQTASVALLKYSYMPTTQTHSGDTEWYDEYFDEQSLPAPLPVDNDIEFVLPSFGYYITEDSTDTQGLMVWQKITSTQVNSGEYDIIFKH